MAGNHDVPMYVQKDGERVQVGWASSLNEGVRTFEFSPGHENLRARDVSFGDDEDTQRAAEEAEAERLRIEGEQNVPDENDPGAPQWGDEGKDSAPLQVPVNETVETADDAEETVELSAGGSITEVSDEDEEDTRSQEEIDFDRELAEEEAGLSHKERLEDDLNWNDNNG